MLTGNRTSPRAYDAQFLLAQALMGQRQYSQAAIAYDDTYNRSRKGAHAPDALLGLANSLIAINEKKAACDTLAKLRTEYPSPRPDMREAIAGVGAARRLQVSGPRSVTGDDDGSPITDAEFAAAMAALGPFEPAPRLAAGVSGGADSMALALLADAWARERGGSLLALVVDHGLRAEFGDGGAADRGAAWLHAASRRRLLTIDGLARGPALAERARAARFAVLDAACAAAGILHLLLGHHAGDQAETVLIRALGGSGPAGLAGMAPLVETPRLRILRPLLAMPPARLRATLAAAGVAWVEDPSNADPTALRPRLRLLRRDRDGAGAATAALVAAAAASARSAPSRTAGRRRAWRNGSSLRPEGFAVLSATAARAAGAGGAAADDRRGAVSAAHPIRRRARRGAPAGDAGRRPAAAGGPAGCRDCWPCASLPPWRRRFRRVPGAVWDGRFRLGARRRALPPGATLGALGDDAARLRTALAAAVRRAADPAGDPARRNASRRAASALS